MASTNAVGVIEYEDKDVRTDLIILIAISRTDDARTNATNRGYCLDGTGFKIAVWKIGPTDTSFLEFEDGHNSPSAVACLRRLLTLSRSQPPGK